MDENTPKLTTRAIAPRPSTIRDDDRSVEFAISTEAPAVVFDWERYEFVPEVLLQSGMRAPGNGQVPFQDSHSTKSVADVLGSMRDLRQEGDITIGRAYFSRKQKAFDAWQDVKDGHITDVSVGYEVTKSAWIPDGQRQNIAGREYVGPLRVSQEWHLREVSLVAIGADHGAKVRTEPNGHPAGKNNQEERMEKPENITPTAPPPAPAAVVDTEAIRAEAQKQERARITEIRKACAFDGCNDLAESAIADGSTPDQVRAAVLERLQKQAVSMASPRVEMGATDSEKFRAAARDALVMRAIGARAVATPAQGAEQMARISFLSLAQECLRRAGQNPAFLSKEEIYSRALGRRSSSSTPSLNSGDFSYVLADVATKAMMTGWNFAPTTYQMWCSIGDLPDFKAARRVRLSDAPDLLETIEGAEVQHGIMSDTGESVQLVTYARKLCITRQALINDDLGVFNAIFQAFGARAANLINALPYAVLAANANLADAVALFSTASTRLNQAGSGGAISASTLAAGIAAMFGQTAPQGSKLNISPRFLLTGGGYKTQAEIVTGSVAMPDATFSEGVRNPFNTLIAVADANIPGNAWYLAGDPMTNSTVEVAFLDGQRTPTLREEETSPILGMDFTAYIDATAKALDFRALYKNVGG
jgi:hypothetical protein